MEQLEILLEAIRRTVSKKQLMVKSLSVAFFPSENKETKVPYSRSPQRVTGLFKPHKILKRITERKCGDLPLLK